MSARIWVLAGLLASAVPAVALAQAPPSDQAPAAETQRTDGRDLVGTSTIGDVGLWFVPLADTNGRGRWRGSAARTSRNTVQGHLNVADFTASVSYGLWNRADVFVSWDAIARVDRDVRPLFIPTDAERGGVDASAPFARESWSGNQRADLRIGAKVKLVDEYSGAPVSLSLRGSGRLPTGDYKDGGGVGAPELNVEGIASRWAGSRFVVSGSAGYSQRNNPTGDAVEVSIPPLFTWGGGVGFLPVQTLLLHGEVIGERPLKRDTTNLSQQLVAADGSLSPMQNLADNHRAIAAGMTWMARSGFFLGAAARWDFPMRDRPTGTRVADYTDIQVRLGWRPGVRSASAISAMPAPAPPAVDTGAADREAAARAAADREAAERSAAERAAAEKAAAAAAAAPPATAARREFVFEDVYFDFDRYSLRPEALRILDEAVASMNEAKSVRMIIEGHTCNIGTTEYNLALGDRRANAVYQYLVSHGISASRLSAVSFGEERPKHDNAREETRRLNRRAALVVRLETTNDQR